ncbi:MAG TPA: hypothetical protein VKH82_19205 [Candidatus Binatia bacterium]|nr:hypothetical protein [Candidatus Binatia bacterium]
MPVQHEDTLERLQAEGRLRRAEARFQSGYEGRTDLEQVALRRTALGPLPR